MATIRTFFRLRHRSVLAIAVVVATLIGFSSVALAAPPSHAPGQQKKQAPTTSTTVAPTPTTVAPTTSTSTPTTTTAPPATTTTTTAPATASVIGPWRGVYAPHGWVAVPRPAQEIRAAVSAVRDAGFNQQLLNLGYLDPTGTIAPSVHPALADWISVSRSVDPSMGIVLWINGGEAAHVENTAVHAAMTTWLAGLVATHQVDGVMLDLEPFRQDNPAFLSLMGTLRSGLPGTWIGVNGPADGQWSSAFIRELSGIVDAVAPMLYDTSLTRTSDYSALVAAEHDRFVVAASGRAMVLPTLPAYGKNQWHDPAVENITSAVAGIRSSSTGSAVGAAVYNWHELDAASAQQWRTAIGS